MSQWREFEINNFIGLQDGVQAAKNSFKTLVNFDLRGKEGALVSRPGFDLKYGLPSYASFPANKLSGVQYLGFANFYVNSAEVSQEITILVAKGTIASTYIDTDYTVPSLNSILLFASHSWNGSAWVEGWKWLNEIIVTQFSAQDVTDKFKIRLDFQDATVISSNYLNNWTVYDTESGNIFKVVDTYDYGSGYVGIKGTLNETLVVSPVVAQSAVYLMKNYIPIEYLQGNYSASEKDIVFHKILDELRIGFGGYKNRLGLSVKYKKDFIQLKEYEFGSGDTAYTDAINIQNAGKIDGLILDPYTAIGFNNYYKIDLNRGSGVNYDTTKRYFVRMTGKLDGFNEVLLAENNIVFSTTGDLVVLPKIKLGAENKKLTSIRLWLSKSSLTSPLPDAPFYFLDEIDLRNLSYGGEIWTVDDEGYLTRREGTEMWLILDNDDPSAGGDIVSGDWAATNFILSDDNPNDALKFTFDASGSGAAKLSLSDLVAPNIKTRIRFNAWASNANTYKLVVGVYTDTGDFYDLGTYALGTSAADDAIFLPEIEGDFSSSVLEFGVEDTNRSGTAGHFWELANLSIKKFYEEEYGAVEDNADELNSSLGYTPTRNLCLSWDSAKVTQGRTYLVNPYIDKRYVNKIFFSSISGAGAFMYDVIPASQFLDLEKFDGNELIDIEVLPNMDFLAISRNSAQRVDPITNQTRDITQGVGCISRRSIVSFGNRIIYAGEYGIIETDGNNYRTITDGQVQTHYEGLTETEKSGIIGGYAEKQNTYLFVDNDSVKPTWFLLTQRGWITFEPYYRSATYISIDKEGNIWYLYNGQIYKTEFGIFGDDNSSGVAQGLKTELTTQDFDVDLLGPELTGKFKIYINSIRLYYRTYSSVNKLRVYLNGSATAFKSFDIADGGGSPKKAEYKLPLGAICDRFNLKIDSNNDFSFMNSRTEIYSIAILWKPIPVGKYG